MLEHRSDERLASTTNADAIIIGAGLAGTCAATVLARRGLRVALIDAHEVYPQEFRAEKLGDPHLALFRRLGLEATVQALMTPVDDIVVYRFGRQVAREHRREYGFAYPALINGLRAALPPSVHVHVGRVAEVHLTDDIQTVALSNGTRIVGRVVVVATGLGDAIRRAVGVERTDLRRGHSLSLGFDLAGSARAFPFGSLTAYGYRREDRIAYLTFFPLDDRMRANFFVYRDAGEAWTRNFRNAPQAMLRRLMPELEHLCQGFDVVGAVDVRPIDLTKARNVRSAGFVLVGDAFSTTCPVPGVGILRVLTDVERLCSTHLPRWLETSGMGEDKIAQYYNDRVKTRVDRVALRSSIYARSMVTDPGLAWSLRRMRNTLVRKGLYRSAGVLASVRSAIRPAPRRSGGVPAEP